MNLVNRQALGVLALCTSLNLIARGVGESFAIFLLPIAREFGTDRAALTGVYSTYMLMFGLMSPLAGFAHDRLGPRRCYGAGLLLFGGAYVLASTMTALWQLYVLVGIVGAVGAALIGTVPASSLVSRWFRARLPSAMSVLYAAMGTGMLAFAPTTQWLIEHFGWRGAYQAFGALLLALFLPIVLLPWRSIAAGSPEVLAATALRAGGNITWTIPRALRTSVFWALSGVLFFTSITTYTISVQLVAYLIESGITPLRAASIFGLVGMVSIVGMMGSGVLAQRFGERAVATVSYSGTIIGIGVLALVQSSPTAVLIGAFLLLFGTMQGTRGPLVAVLSARNFAGGGMGRVYGSVLLGMGVGAAIGSWASGMLYDLTGGYHAGFLLAAAAAACGLLLFWTVKGLSGRT
jgi:MFS family permease